MIMFCVSFNIVWVATHNMEEKKKMSKRSVEATHRVKSVFIFRLMITYFTENICHHLHVETFL